MSHRRIGEPFKLPLALHQDKLVYELGICGLRERWLLGKLELARLQKDFCFLWPKEYKNQSTDCAAIRVGSTRFSDRRGADAPLLLVDHPLTTAEDVYASCAQHQDLRRIPISIEPLVRDGLVDKVIRSLKSGKEATVYMVLSEGEVRCAKVYKGADKRSFRQQAEYREGRKIRNSRRARAMAKRTRYGRREQEAAWQSAEMDALFRLSAAGVRAPKPYGFVDGVLLMELIVDDHGDVAPRLNDMELTGAQARAYHGILIAQIVRMLCAGLIHGDLSEYNVLVGSDGPVIIDLPQAVDAAGNNNACRMLERDVDNLTTYFSHYAPELRATDYGKEIWALYESGALHPQIELTGRFERSATPADVASVLQDIEAAREEADKQRRDWATSMIEIDG